MSQYCDDFFDLWETADGFNMYEDCEDEFQSWDGLRGPPGPKGDPGTGLTIAGMVETADELPDVASEYDVWLVGDEAPYTGYMFYDGDWIDIGEVGAGLVGPQGPAGPAGPPGAAGSAGPQGPPEIPTTSISYQSSSSGTTPPTGTWSSSPVSVDPGDYLWTRVILTYSNNTTATYYAVAYQGTDGSVSFSSDDPSMDGTASPGSSADVPHADHVHPTDTSRAEAATHKLKSYTSVEELGLTIGSATIAEAWAALPIKTVLIAAQSHFSATETPGSGTVVMEKSNAVTGISSKGLIAFYGLTEVVGDYRMFISGNSPTGIWVPVSQPGSATPLMDGTAAVGTSTAFAREDHVHPSDTSRVATADMQFKAYDSVADLGLTSGSATIAGAWAALSGQNAMLICDASEFTTSSGGVPSVAGNVLMYRIASNNTRGIIRYFSRVSALGDYAMGIDTDGTPLGTWLLMSAYESGTVSITNGSKDSNMPTRVTKSGAVVNLQGLTSGSSVTTSWAKLGQISGDNLKPSHDTTGACMAGYTAIQMRVLTTGEIQVRGGSNLSSQSIRFNLTWII